MWIYNHVIRASINIAVSSKWVAFQFWANYPFIFCNCNFFHCNNDNTINARHSKLNWLLHSLQQVSHLIMWEFLKCECVRFNISTMNWHNERKWVSYNSIQLDCEAQSQHVHRLVYTNPQSWLNELIGCNSNTISCPAWSLIFFGKRPRAQTSTHTPHTRTAQRHTYDFLTPLKSNFPPLIIRGNWLGCW